MILSHKYKFVCLNPPKTGSGFRENTLKQYADLSIISEKSLNLRHWNSSEASNYIKSINKNPNDYYWFTFVRNPWERMISWVNMKKNKSLDKGVSVDIDIEDFISRTLKQNSFKNYIYRDGQLLDFVGSLENITEDLRFILNKLNIDADIGFRKDKYIKNFKEEIRSQLSQKTIDLILCAEKEVIDMKNYSFK